MGEDITGILGVIIGIAISYGNFDQLRRVIKMKDCSQISRRLYVILVAAGAVWLIHGIFRHNIYIIITQAVCLTVNIPSLIYYLFRDNIRTLYRFLKGRLNSSSKRRRKN